MVVRPVRNRGSTDLVCSITLDYTLPSGAMIQVMWTGPAGPLSGTTPSGAGTVYNSTLSITSVSSSDAGTYTCNVSVVSNTQYLISSPPTAGSVNVTVQSELQYLFINSF